MCGINGFYNYSGQNLPDDGPLIEAMNATIAHRGPDDSGIWLDGARKVHFGHQRLSILDLSRRGHQPMLGPNGTVIVYNGEIYNFQELREKLNGREFRSDTDTEVLLRLYDESGPGCLSQLNGMFAFALWDGKTEKLFLARDRIGIKPLYYSTINGIFAFSSEIKALLTLPWIKAELNEEALYHFLTFNKVSPPQTMFKGISKFHPGYKMIVGTKGIEVYEPYWEVSYSQCESLSVEDQELQIINSLRQAVQYRMVSDVPVGAFLSGGVDSSAIVALMKEMSPRPVRTYSIGFDGVPSYDEREHAQRISTAFGTDHHEIVVRQKDIVEFLPKIVDIYDEPLADATSIPIYFISRLARENGTIVILTGDGADELFCGYRNWLRYAKLYPLYRLLTKTPKTFKNLLAKGCRVLDEDSPLYETMARASKGQEFFWGGAGGFKESAKRAVLSTSFRARMATRDSHDHIQRCRDMFHGVVPAGRRGSYIDWMSFVGVKDIIPNYYLYRADRLGMANSVELRVPFLDHHMVNLALSIPGNLKIKHNEPKYILKKSLESILPKETLYRRKQGFCVPLEEWMKDTIVDYIESRSENFCNDTGLFHKEGIDNLVRQCRRGNKNVVYSLWNIYFLMAWFHRWLL